MKSILSLPKAIILALFGLLSTASVYAQSELITNGGFETTGASFAWTLETNGTNSTDSWWNINLLSGAHAGNRYEYLGAQMDGATPANNVNGLLYQTVAIPSGTTSATLSYYLRITTSEAATAAFDHLYVEIQSTNGGVLATANSYSNLNSTSFSSWTKQSVDVSSYAGQSIRVAFHGTTDGATITVFRIDDVSLLATETAPAPTVQTLAASSVSSTSEQLSGTINPNGFATTGYFEYGPTTGYGSATLSGNYGSGTTVQNASTTIAGLAAGTLYHYRIVASNTNGTNRGGDMTFTTVAAARALGIDVSHVRGTINWTSVAGAGKAFAIIKASDGYRTSQGVPMFTDSNFSTYIPAAIQAGLKVGAYHFARPYINSAKSEADFFLGVAGNYIGAGFLPPLVDIEDPSDDAPSNQVTNMGKVALSQWIREFCAEIQSVKGVKPMLYMTPYFTRNLIEDDLAQFPLWIAFYPSTADVNPTSLGPWNNTWIILQYAVTGTSVSGVQNSPVDLDAFDGDTAALNSFINGGGGDNTPPTIAAFNVSPSQIALGQGFTASYNVSDAGGSHLKQVELWRASVDGTINDPSWTRIGSAIALAGDGPSFGSFQKDIPATAGSYWYGIHVTDNSNNYMNERVAGIGPKMVTVLPAYTIAVSASPANGGSGSGGGTFQMGSSQTVTATANGGFTFTSWTENGSVASISASYSFTLNGNRNLVANFTPIPYTITVGASPANGGTVSGGGTFNAGTSQTVVATANGSYVFTNWTENGNVASTSASYNFTLNGNRNLVANFTPTYTITVSASPANGGTVSGGGTFGAGTSQTVIATANEGYAFMNWTANGNVASTSASYNFTLAGNRTLVANFTPAYTITVSASPASSGTVTGGGTFSAGSSRTVTATTNSGYVFTNWTANGNVASTSASYNFTLNGDRNLVANFTPTYTIAVSASPANGGSVSGGGTFQMGSSQTVTVTANGGFTFTNWTENGSVASISASYSFTLNGNRNLVANFTPIPYTITVGASPANGGAVSGGGTFNASTSQTVTATANRGYVFANWTENGNVASTSASYNFTLNGNRNLVANFTPTYTITVSASPANGGTVSGGVTFGPGTSQTVTATANSGYAFTNWTENGNMASTSASYNFTLNGDRNLVANFSPRVETPSISPDGGAFLGSVQVTLACTTPGAAIYYTVDGTNPTGDSIVYRTPITISNTTMVRAKAIANGYADSLIVSADFNDTSAQPDNWIGLSLGAMKGVGVYNEDAIRQTLLTKITRGSIKTILVLVNNTGAQAADFTVKGDSATIGFRVHYYLKRTEITAQVLAGTFSIPALVQSHPEIIKIRVVAMPRARLHTVQMINIRTQNAADPTKIDVVQIQAKAK